MFLFAAMNRDGEKYLEIQIFLYDNYVKKKYYKL